MNDFFNQLSKGTLAALVIGAGILFLLIYDPPRSVCDIQVDTFRQSQDRFLYPQKKGVVEMRPEFDRLIDHCRGTNSPGGCYEFFLQMRTMVADMNKVSRECRSRVGRVRNLKTRVLDSLELLVRLAWGESPPASYTQKFGWLDAADMSLFCSLRLVVELFYGESEWEKFRERMFEILPGAAEMPRQEVWELMIVSENCARFP